MYSQEQNNWEKWCRRVLVGLKRLSSAIEAVDEKIDLKIDNLDNKINDLKDNIITPIKVEIAMLKVKSGVWGLIGGAIPVILMFLSELLKKD